MEADKVVRTVCTGYHCKCGMLAHVKDGKVVKIEGDPDHPRSKGVLCPKGLTSMQLLYHPDRLKYPMKRTGGRGEGKWQRISWDEALDTITAKYKEILERYGPEAIAWVYGDGYRGNEFYNYALLNALGSPNAFNNDAHYCLVPAILADRITFGQPNELTHEVGPDFENSRCMLVWGANPFHSHPIMGGEIVDSKARGAKLIVIDPRFTNTASKADMWLQVRPGTDCALALGMLNVIVSEKLYDEEFVDRWCAGFDKLKERVEEYPPDKVAQITWVPAKQIREAARMYATVKPSALHTRMGVFMSVNSVQTLRAQGILMAITGNVDVKGGNLIINPPTGFRPYYDLFKYLPKFSQETHEKRLGAREFPLLAGPSHKGFVDCHPPTVIKTMLSGKPYPVKAMWSVNDMVMALENTKETQQALMNLDIFVVTDFFLTPTARLADIVLPAATFLERDELHEVNHYNNFIAVGEKAIEPLYECRDEKEVIVQVFKRMGLSLPLPMEKPKDFFDFQLAGMGITYDEFKRKSPIVEPKRYKKYEDTGFRAPSGKVELYSTVLEKFGYDPLPHYVEPPQSPVSDPELAREYPLILTSGARHIAFFHSGQRQISWLRRLHPDPLIEIHPDTAEKLGIRDGDWVWIETPDSKGRVKQRAKLTLGIRPECVEVESHWWFPEAANGNCLESNINVIMPNDPPREPIVGATPLRGRLCRIYKMEEES